MSKKKKNPRTLEVLQRRTFHRHLQNFTSLLSTVEASPRQPIFQYALISFVIFVLNLDTPALQGTHASSDSPQQVFHTQIQAQDSLWSHHCLSSGLSFSDSIFSICDWFITTTISHIQKTFDPLRVIVIYLLAAYSERQAFLSDLIRHPSSVFDLAPHIHILLRDFKHSYTSHLSASLARQVPSS